MIWFKGYDYYETSIEKRVIYNKYEMHFVNQNVEDKPTKLLIEKNSTTFAEFIESKEQRVGVQKTWYCIRSNL